jgi:aspartyl-tRNA synthetase
MSFVKQDDVLNAFESMARAIFAQECGVTFPPFQRMAWSQAMDEYGIDKPDLRFDMRLHEITHLAQGHDFKFFDEAEYVVALALPQAGGWPAKKVKDLEKSVQGDQVGAAGLVWAKVKSLKAGALDLDSSAKKFFDTAALKGWADATGAAEGDLICVFWGPRLKTQTAAGKFRHLMGTELGLRSTGFSALWVVDFPLLEYDEDEGRYVAMHHPFTSCKPEVRRGGLSQTARAHARARGGGGRAGLARSVRTCACERENARESASDSHRFRPLACARASAAHALALAARRVVLLRRTCT